MTEHVVDAASLKGLSHPIRLQLLAALQVRGQATASQLAGDIDESSGTTSYHLRQLHRHRFVEEVEGRGNARERWWQPITGGWSMPNFDLQADGATKASADFVTRTILQNSYNQVAAFLSSALDWPQEWQDAAQRYEWHFDLTPEQTTALNEELLEVLVKYKAIPASPGSRRVAVEGTTFPVGLPPSADEPVG